MTIKLIRDVEKNFGRKKSRNVSCRGILKLSQGKRHSTIELQGLYRRR